MSTTSAAPDFLRPLVAEALGTLLLVAGVVGSGIMAQRLTHDVALELLCNTLATGALLTVLILIFAPISGAQFNPAVTLALKLRGEISAKRALFFVIAQLSGGVAGTLLAHLMFALPVLATGTTVRTGLAQWLAELVATAGLLLTIFGCRGQGPRVVAPAVGLYISAAYWFTSSTSFANPAVTLARALTPSFAGIRPYDVPGFVLAQCLAALLVVPVANWLFAKPQPSATRSV
jgi:glycerol uptake facilitator-like aquaporin